MSLKEIEVLMINLILFSITVLFFHNAKAANYMNVEVLNSGGTAAYSEKERCPEPCVDIGDNPPELIKIIESKVDDAAKPVYKDSFKENCNTVDTCYEQAKTLCKVDEVLEIRPISDIFEIYCKTVIAFEKKTAYAAEVDPVKKQESDAYYAKEREKVAAREAALSRLNEVDIEKIDESKMLSVIKDILESR